MRDWELVPGHGAAQQAREADLLIETRFEASFVLPAFRFKFGCTASASWQLMRGPLGCAEQVQGK